LGKVERGEAIEIAPRKVDPGREQEAFECIEAGTGGEPVVEGLLVFEVEDEEGHVAFEAVDFVAIEIEEGHFESEGRPGTGGAADEGGDEGIRDKKRRDEPMLSQLGQARGLLVLSGGVREGLRGSSCRLEQEGGDKYQEHPTKRSPKRRPSDQCASGYRAPPSSRPLPSRTSKTPKSPRSQSMAVSLTSSSRNDSGTSAATNPAVRSRRFRSVVSTQSAASW